MKITCRDWCENNSGQFFIKSTKTNVIVTHNVEYSSMSKYLKQTIMMKKCKFKREHNSSWLIEQ
jgi:hypothetical protein